MEALKIIAIFVSFASIPALYLAWRSRVLAQQAFSLSLFNNRYKFYRKFINLIEELSLSGFPTEKHLERMRFMRLESRYIYGKEIEDLIGELIDGAKAENKIKNPKGTKEDYEALPALSKMEKLLEELSGKKQPSTLDSYFHQYLYNEAFKKKI